MPPAYPGDRKVCTVSINTSASGCILYRAGEGVEIQKRVIVMRTSASEFASQSRVLYFKSRGAVKYSHNARVLMRVYRQMWRIQTQCKCIRRRCIRQSRGLFVFNQKYFNKSIRTQCLYSPRWRYFFFKTVILLPFWWSQVVCHHAKYNIPM